jgi:hypothetical protein
MQRENNFNLLTRLANKWKANFILGNNPDGKAIGLFVNKKNMGDFTVQQFIRKSTSFLAERTKELFYNSGSDSNVISYTWKDHVGDSGQGDGNTIQLVNGIPVHTNIVLPGQSVTTWRINPDKIRKKLGAEASISDKINLTKELLSSTNFDQVQWAFDQVQQETAPQGMGFTVECQMLGDPFLTVPYDVIFKKGFPYPLTQNQALIGKRTNFYIQKTNHSFSKGEGYRTSITVVDSYAVEGGAFSLRGNIAVG